MKRSEFIKRLGLSIGAAVAAPKLLAEEKTNCPSLPDDPRLSCETRTIQFPFVSHSQRFTIQNTDNGYIDLSGCNIKMEIKTSNKIISHKPKRIRKGHGPVLNMVEFEFEKPPWEQRYDLIMDNKIINTGVLR